MFARLMAKKAHRVQANPGTDPPARANLEEVALNLLPLQSLDEGCVAALVRWLWA